MGCFSASEELLFGMAKPPKREQWQSFVDDSLLITGQVTQAAIHGVDGMRWASSPDLKVRSNGHAKQRILAFVGSGFL